MRSFASITLLIGCIIGAHASPRVVGTFSVQNAAFSNLATFPASSAQALIVTQFTGNPFAKDGITIVPDIANSLKNVSGTDAVQLLNDITWPNDVEQTSIPGNPDANALLVPYGFLVPPKTVGGVDLVQIGSDLTSVVSKLKLTKDKGNALDGWFYHKAMWVDMNGDGRLDVLTARATKPILGAEGGELVWLEQPSSDPWTTSPWQEHVISSGKAGDFTPDVFFELMDITGDGVPEVLYASFFTGGSFGFLTSTCVEGGTVGPSSWDPTQGCVKHVVVDNSTGPAFGLWLNDLNNDGKVDVLFTNHVDNKTSSYQSAVFAYEIPDASDVTVPAAWRRHTLTSGFLVREGGPAQAAPGAASAFHPRTDAVVEGAEQSSKPSVLVEGDGDQRLYVLTPLSEDPSDWSYNRTQIYDCTGTVGQASVADVNGDGWADIFCPCYDHSYVTVMTYASL